MAFRPTPQWLTYAIASGGCAALNGVFAKLTTTQLTTTWATAISHILGMRDESVIVEGLVRGFFFLMNLAFNAVMWGLFTNALRLASSTVRVSVINTSANFMLTAILGWVIFKESLPGLWWLGASFLVAGSVIIGRREEGKDAETVAERDPTTAAAAGVAVNLETYTDEPDAPPPSVSRTPTSANLETGGAYASDDSDSEAPETMDLLRQGAVPDASR
ncbi:hypothetical protein CB0940_07023 [Cercospora beticola]|uniref:Transmembrane protein 42 n=1 Tax=Cercospora beticola TaxID=122368 RepID=A0A2G5H9E4_CERBT|nr:hypothetical protein CB0940_07023 [Cercospora beticola]PIA89155.1 hypothetical protein CB0940_07023 [Cercospora beticola]WPB02945.1 hypothetical protein RHO25_007581 [Cercospora beticola]CAK1358355.1 unnamed protein product [Cercospora beticola]